MGPAVGNREENLISSELERCGDIFPRLARNVELVVTGVGSAARQSNQELRSCLFTQLSLVY